MQELSLPPCFQRVYYFRREDDFEMSAEEIIPKQDGIVAGD